MGPRISTPVLKKRSLWPEHSQMTVFFLSVDVRNHTTCNWAGQSKILLFWSIAPHFTTFVSIWTHVPIMIFTYNGSIWITMRTSNVKSHIIAPFRVVIPCSSILFFCHFENFGISGTVFFWIIQNSWELPLVILQAALPPVKWFNKPTPQ
jgi:hypothetical protein